LAAPDISSLRQALHLVTGTCSFLDAPFYSKGVLEDIKVKQKINPAISIGASQVYCSTAKPIL